MSEPGAEEHFGGTGAEERSSGGVSEGLRSLAAFLGVPLSRVIELRDLGPSALATAIERRNAGRDPAVALRYVERRFIPD
jgi:hypothetical protein